MKFVTGITPAKVKGGIYLGGGGTTPVFTRSVDPTLVSDFTEIKGDFLNLETFPAKQYLSFNPSRKPSFLYKIREDQKERFQQWTGLSWDRFLVMYKPELLGDKRNSNVRLYFINEEAKIGDGQARIYYEEYYIDEQGKNKTKIFLLASPKTKNRSEILDNIHPALKELVGNSPEDHKIAISAAPSETFPIIHAEEMRIIYQALGVPANQIEILTDQNEETSLNIINNATIIDVSGGNQRVYERKMGAKPDVVQAAIDRVHYGLSAILTTSASAASIGQNMIAGTGSYETAPLSVSRFNVENCGTWIVTGLGVLKGIFTDTHLLGPKNDCNSNGECKTVETGRDRVSRFLASLLSLTKLYSVSKEDLPIGIASTEGTFGEIKDGKLRVISDHRLGGCYVIDPKKIVYFQFDVRGTNRDKVVTLTSAKACRVGETEPKELIWDQKTQRSKGSSGCYLTTSRFGREENPNAFDGVGMIWNGEVLDLDTMELTVARADMEHSFPLAEGCRFIDENGHDTAVPVIASLYCSNNLL